MAGSQDAKDNPMTRNRRIVEEVIKESTITKTNNTDDIKTDLSVVMEYAKESLLPPSEACAPLINLRNNHLMD